MIPPELLAIVRCPATGQTLSPCPAEILAAANARIAAGSSVNAGGQRASEPMADGLLRADGSVVYPVRDDIPVLLAEEGISLSLP